MRELPFDLAHRLGHAADGDVRPVSDLVARAALHLGTQADEVTLQPLNRLVERDAARQILDPLGSNSVASSLHVDNSAH